MALNERIGMYLTQEAAEGRTDHNNGWNGVNGMAVNERIGMYLTQEAAEGRTDHNNGWNGVNGMVPNTWKPCD
jgi:hypothetical protein